MKKQSYVDAYKQFTKFSDMIRKKIAKGHYDVMDGDEVANEILDDIENFQSELMKDWRLKGE